MKIGIGIDTGGTCTDAVIYHFEQRKILAFSKTNTTRDDLSRGIGEALALLPEEKAKQAEVIALSTTLATNACVENKGGRAKLIFFGVNPENVARVGQDYGFSKEDSLIFIDSKTRPNGQVVREPDWEEFRRRVRTELKDCDAAAVVEMFAKKSGACMEKRAREIIREELNIPVVCGHELFAENNIVKRGASLLLNARLISVISEFIEAVKKALDRLDFHIPFVIVRSDGSLMNEEFAREHPIETLLCGPVASVMGAGELTEEQNSIVVDIGGTTTDIAFVKNGTPQTVENGVRIGKWNTFVKGLFVDTFALGGDSGVVLDAENRICLEDEKVMPVCMASHFFPDLKSYLRKEAESPSLAMSQKDEIYLTIREIGESGAYTREEKELAGLMRQPLSLKEAGAELERPLMRRDLQRLVREGVIIRCGLTPTDAMHVLGDFVCYDAEASMLALKKLGRIRRKTEKEICREIYDQVKRKLYCNIVRILLEDADQRIGEQGISEQTAQLIDFSYEAAKEEKAGFFRAFFSTSAVLTGVGAPTHVFLPDVGKLLGTRTITPEYSKVANALGAIVGNVTAKVIMEVVLDQKEGSYTVFGKGKRYVQKSLDEAKVLARKIAEEKAREEAEKRGADRSVRVRVEESEDIVDTDFGPLFMGYKVIATAEGQLQLSAEKENSDNGI